jgi:hypothetical protein
MGGLFRLNATEAFTKEMEMRGLRSLRPPKNPGLGGKRALNILKPWFTTHYEDVGRVFVVTVYWYDGTKTKARQERILTQDMVISRGAKLEMNEFIERVIGDIPDLDPPVSANEPEEYDMFDSTVVDVEFEPPGQPKPKKIRPLIGQRKIIIDEEGGAE